MRVFSIPKRMKFAFVREWLAVFQLLVRTWTLSTALERRTFGQDRRKPIDDTLEFVTLREKIGARATLRPLVRI